MTGVVARVLAPDDAPRDDDDDAADDADDADDAG